MAARCEVQRFFSWFFSILVIAILVLAFFSAAKGFTQLRERRMEATAKQNAHAIQLAIERYATDFGGEYPPFLIGGDRYYAPEFDPYKADGRTMRALKNGRDVSESNSPIDPLLSRGYLESYPRNPFIKDALAVARLQTETDDPLRNDGKGAIFGTRFGASCALMGNVMPDHRFPSGAEPDFGASVLPGEIEGVDFAGYPMYDFAETEKPDYFLPGMFFYRSSNPLIHPRSSVNPKLEPFRPIVFDH